MDTKSLEVLINNWLINQSDFSEKASLRILASLESIQIHIQLNPLLKDCLNRNSIPEEFSNHLISSTRNIIIKKLRDYRIGWNNADLLDFLKLFPTKETFNNRKGAGKRSIKLMDYILMKNNLEWPDR